MEFEHLAGAEFAGLSVKKLIGKSASGIVYAAEKDGVPYALKALPPRLPSTMNEAASRFNRDLEAAAGIKSDNVVRIVSTGEYRGIQYAVLEFVDGGPLTRLVSQKGRLAPAEAASVMRGILLGLAAGHSAGLVHGGLSPACVMVTGKGQAKVMGFGISKRLLAEAGVAMPGYEIETAEYITPEHVSDSPVDERSDLYAAGLVLFEMLAGRPPFTSESMMAVRMMHATEEPPDLAAEVPGVTQAMAAYVRRLMAKEPSARFDSAAEAVSALDSAFGTAPGAAPAPQKPQTVRTEPRKLDPGRDSKSILAAMFSTSDEAEAMPVAEEPPRPAPAPQKPAQAPKAPAPAPGPMPPAPEAGKPRAPQPPPPPKPAAPPQGKGKVPVVSDADFAEYGELLDRGQVKRETQIPERISAAEQAGKEPKTRDKMGQAEDALARFDFIRAVFLLNQILAASPGDKAAAELLKKATALRDSYIRKTEEFERLMDKGSEKDIEKLAREILEIKPDDPGARNYVDSLETLRKEALKKEEAQRLVLKCYRLMERKSFDEVEAVIEQITALDAQNPDVAKLGEEIRAKRAKIAELRIASDEEIARKDYVRAIAALKELKSLLADPAEIDARIKEILAVQEKLDKLIENAERLWDDKAIEKAEVALQEVLDTSPENPRALKLKREVEGLKATVAGLREKAEGLFASGAFADARELYGKICRMRPGDYDAEQKTAQIEVILKDRAGARIRKISILAGAAAVLIAAVAGFFVIRGRNQGVIEEAETLYSQGRFDEAAAALDGLGDFLTDVSRRDELKARVRTAIEKSRPPDVKPGPGPGPGPAAGIKTLISAAEKLAAEGKWKEAFNAVEEAMKKGASEADIEPAVRAATIARILEEGAQSASAGDWAAALESYRKISRLDASMSAAAINGLFDEQIKASEPLKSSPDRHAEFLRKVGKAFGREEETEALVRKADEESGIGASRAARKGRDFKKAVEILRTAAGKNPAYASAIAAEIAAVAAEMKSLAEGLYAQGRFAEGVSILEQAKALFTDVDFEPSIKTGRMSLLLARGESEFNAGDVKAARKTFEEAALIGPNQNARDWLDRISILELTGKAEEQAAAMRWSEAVETYSKVLAVRKDHPEALKRIKELKALIGYGDRLSRMEALFVEGRYPEALAEADAAASSGADANRVAAKACAYLRQILKMAEIPEGEFGMGDDAGAERERPASVRKLGAFRISRNEVTVAEYAAFLATPAGKGHTPPDWEAQLKKKDLPVTAITLDDARAYAKSVFCEIPTEEEWERAARGQDGRAWPWGAEFGEGKANTYEAGRKGLAPVAEFAGDVSQTGCLNMAGNAAEWTESPFAAYPGSAKQIPPGKVVVRGGDFNFGKNYAKCSARRGLDPNVGKSFVGFRCVLRSFARSLLELE